MFQGLFYIVGFCSFLIACQNSVSSVPEQAIDHFTIVDTNSNAKTVALETNTVSEKNEPIHTSNSTLKDNAISKILSNNSYAWLDNYNPETSIQEQIPVPSGYVRLDAAENSFATWLRGLPLEPQGSSVMLYNGLTKPYQEGAYRVINIDIGSRDLQQCADAVMRLKAEYHYSLKEFDKIHFNYTSGDNIRFSDWSKGKQPQVKGSKVSFSAPNGTTDTSYKNFKKYLNSVFNYAGTASLSKELVSKKVEDIDVGDVFIWGGFPGHAILVVDVAQHQSTGKKIFLVAQSYMPAQSIHLLKNFNDKNLSPWYSEDFGSILETPEWTFERSALKRFSE